VIGGEAEVDQHDALVLRDDHIARLDVAVNLARRVQRDQPGRQLAQSMAEPTVLLVAGQRRSVEGGRGAVARVWQPGRVVIGAALHVAKEPGAPHQLHGVEPLAVAGDELVELDQVGVDDVGQAAKLALQAVDVMRVQAAQNLECHISVAAQVARRVDHTDGARTQALADLVVAEHGAPAQLVSLTVRARWGQAGDEGGDGEPRARSGASGSIPQGG
jgi:hypothetical protein